MPNKPQFKLLNLNTQNLHSNQSESLNTTEESLLKAKLQPSTLRFPKLTSTCYSPRTTQSSYSTPNHSILCRFQREIKTQFTSAIDKEINLLSHTLTSLKQATKTKRRINDHTKFILKKQKISSREREKDFNKMTIEALTITTETHTTQTFNEPNTISSFKPRIRSLNPNMKIDPKWKMTLGVYSIDLKTVKCLINDIKYQSHYIKDQMRLLLDNIQYYKVTILSSNEILSALKNKNIKAQINHNRLLEEQCVLFHQIPRKMLRDFYGYADKFISVPLVSLNTFDQKPIVNEASCFIENARLLNSLFAFLKWPLKFI